MLETDMNELTQENKIPHRLMKTKNLSIYRVSDSDTENNTKLNRKVIQIKKNQFVQVL